MTTTGLSSKTSEFSQGSSAPTQSPRNCSSGTSNSKPRALSRLLSFIFCQPQVPHVHGSSRHGVPQNNPETLLSGKSRRRTITKSKRTSPVMEKALPRQLSSRSNSGSSSPPLGKVGEKFVYQLDTKHVNSWRNTKDEVTKVLERSTDSKIGPKPVSILSAYEVELRNWTLQNWTYQKKRKPAIVICCRSQQYGDLLKRELQQSLKSGLFDPSINDFEVLAVQGKFRPLAEVSPQMASAA